MLTTNKNLKGIKLPPFVNYHYVESYDDKYTIPLMNNPKVLKPIAERALIENMKYNIDVVSLGDFYESLLCYLQLDLNLDMLH